MTTDGHSVPRSGNGFIDLTHAVLMDRVGAIRRACAAGSGRQAVVPHFNAFMDEMRSHFDHEEVIIRAIGFDRWEDHAVQHGQLEEQIGRLVDYVRDCDDVSDVFLCTVAGTLDAALCRHEIRQDGAYLWLVRRASEPPPDDTLIAWTAGYETGVDTVDGQHRQLAETLNELYRLTRRGALRAEGLAMLESLQGLVEAHFATEEGVLRASAPARFVAHRAHHRTLGRQFARVRAEVEEGRIDLGVAVRDFLRFWLMDHVQGADRAAFRP